MLQPKYRIGLVVDALHVPTWVRDFAEWANSHSQIELVAVAVTKPARTSALEALLKVETKCLCRGKAYRPYAMVHPIHGFAPLQIEAAEVERIAELQLDLLVGCCRKPLERALAGAAAGGILSISSDGFSEVVAGRPDTSFAVHQEQGDRRQLLFRGSVATALLYSWNIISLQSRAFQYLRLTVERLAAGRLEGGSEAAAARPLQPRIAELLAYGIRTTSRSVAKALRRLSGREFNWRVAVSRRDWSNGRFEDATTIPNPPNAFLADPFTITVDGSSYLFVEEFPFDVRKGVIAAYRLEGDQAERVGVVLEEPYHLSFPFVFHHKGDVYMVPEGGGGRVVKLYKALNFPTRWLEVKTLLEDVPAVDTILLEHDSRWWMLTTIQGEGPGLNNAELYAFHADDPLSEWTAHSQNPIVMDASKGRNGGFVRDSDGNPCRVAQRPGFTFYGAGSAVYRIDELTPSTYRETLMKEISPTFFAGLDGTHHVHCSDQMTVFDFMRVERPRDRSLARSLSPSMQQDKELVENMQQAHHECAGSI